MKKRSFTILIRSISLFFLLFIITGCHPKTNEKDLSYVLDLAMENRSELERVLTHFKDEPLKLEAAEFLIRNMPGHYSYADTSLLNNYYSSVDSLLLSLKGKHRTIIADSINNLAKRLKIKNATKVEDIKIITSEYLINNIDNAFDQWQNGRWAKHLSFDQFCEYLLPYKIEELQPLDNWRKDYSNFCADSLFELDYCDMFRNSSYSASILLNKNIGHIIKPFSWSVIEFPIYKIAPRLKMPFGRCDDYAALTASLFRSAGIPVSIEINPHWAYRSLGHHANAVLAPNGKSILFSGLSTGPDITHHVDEKLAKMFRVTYAYNPEIRKIHQSEKLIPEPFKSEFLKDVTDEYIGTADIELKTKEESDGYAYLAVYGDNDWYPVDFSYLKDNKIKFDKVGKNVLYIIIKNHGDEFMTISDPFIVDTDGNIQYIHPNIRHTVKAELYRKYPVIEYVHKYARLINGGQFEAANKPDFSDAIIVHTISDGKAIGHNISISDSIPAYRYWRYIQRHRNAHCNMGEVYFYDINGNILQGDVIGTEGYRTIYEGMTRDKLFDRDLLTSFNSPNANGDWAGLDFGKPIHISKIIYYGRGDGNAIEIGDTYELFYWLSGKWKSLGRKIANDVKLTYDNIPANALLLLRDLTKGKDERIFLIDEEGRQQWW